MTDRDLAAAAWNELAKTTDPYPTWVKKGKPPSSHWAVAKAYLDQIDVTPPPPPPTDLKFFGNTLNSDALYNHPVGGPDQRQMSARFRASGGQLKDVRVYFVFDDTGYYGGTGGQIQVSVQTDDGNGDPSGTILAAGVIADPTRKLRSGVTSAFRTVTFASPPTLTPNTIYHLVFTNVDPNPTANWVSVDNLWAQSPTTPRQPEIPDSDLAVLYKDGSGRWTLHTPSTPCFQATYADGHLDGQTYWQTLSRGSYGLASIGGNNQVRETMTIPTGGLTFSGVRVRLYRQQGTAAPLTATLEDSTGNALASGSVAASQVASSAYGAWVTIPFVPPVVVPAGGAGLRLSSSEQANPYKIFGLQDTSEYTEFTVTSPLQFDDGYAQFSTDGGRTWADGVPIAGGRDKDWQLYLTLA